MKKNISLTIVVLAAILCGCHKEVQTPSQLFEFAGQRYATLQDAIDAAVASEPADSIVILANVQTPGARIPANYTGTVTLDLAEHTMEISSGGIELTNSFLTIYGRNGKLVSSDPAIPLISTRRSDDSEDFSVKIDGRVELTAKELLDANSDIFVTPEFDGSLNGNVKLTNCALLIYSNNCTVQIPNLKADGVCPDGMKAAVYYVNEDEIGRNNADSHQHRYEVIQTRDADCIRPQVITYRCAECGFINTVQTNDALAPCDPHNLIHMPAKAATYEEDGCIEHWVCPKCHKAYSDPDARNKLDGGPVIFAGRWISGNQDFRDISRLMENPDNPSNGPFWMDVLNTVTGIAGFGSGLITGILSLVLGPSSKDMSAEFQRVNEKLDAINTKLDGIKNDLARIMEAVKTVPDIVEYNNRLGKLSHLRAESAGVSKLINTILKDTSKDAQQQEKEISALVSDWSQSKYYGADLDQLTRDLMRTFVERKYNGLNYPETLQNIMATICWWEHDGYNVRYMILANDMSAVSCAYLLSILYIKSVKEYASEDKREMDFKAIQEEYKAYVKAIDDEFKRIDDRNEKYRVYCHGGLTFKRDVVIPDFWATVYKNPDDFVFPRLNQENKAAESCEKLLERVGLSKGFMTTEMARELYQHYHDQPGAQPTTVISILKDTVGFRNFPDVLCHVVTDTHAGFDNTNGDSALPNYRMFHWEIYRGKTQSDRFGIRTAIDYMGYDSYRDITEAAAISSYSSGKISIWGTRVLTNWIAPVLAD